MVANLHGEGFLPALVANLTTTPFWTPTRSPNFVCENQRDGRNSHKRSRRPNEKVLSAEDDELPTYAQLESHLHIELTPRGKDQYLFYVVPVMKLQEQEPLMVQMVQAEDQPHGSSNPEIHAIIGDVNHGNYSQPQSLKDVFLEATNPAGSAVFNFQVPMMVPLDLHFKYDQGKTHLPQCSLDTRTWREKVISHVARQMDLKGGRSKEHSKQMKKIRLYKDVLAAITSTFLTNQDALNMLLEVIVQCKSTTDNEYGFLLQNPDTVLSNHLQHVAEGLDTYNLLKNRLELANETAETLEVSIYQLVNSLLTDIDKTIRLLTQLLATLNKKN